MHATYHTTGGFTIIELIVVITIIAILAGLVVFSPNNAQNNARSTEQANDINSIARRLELAYSSQEIGAPSYPSTTEFLNDILLRMRTASKTDPEIFKAPNASDSSVIAATTNATTNPAGINTPTVSQYIYQPIRANGSLCTGNNSGSDPTTRCIKFRLYYRSITNGMVYSVKSIHQQ